MLVSVSNPTNGSISRVTWISPWAAVNTLAFVYTTSLILSFIISTRSSSFILDLSIGDFKVNWFVLVLIPEHS